MPLEQERNPVIEQHTDPDRTSRIRKTAGVFLLLAAEIFSGKAQAEDLAPVTQNPEFRIRNLEQEKAGVVHKLDVIWKAQGEMLQKRAAALNDRHDAVVKRIKSKQMTQFLGVFEKEWNSALQEFTINNGMTLVHYHDFERKLVLLENIARRFEQWEPLKMEKTNPASDEERSAFQESMKERRALEAAHGKLLMTKPDGTVLGLFPEESHRDASLTTAAYLDTLARVIRTPEDLAFFLRYRFEYAFDSDDPANPLKKGTKIRSGEYWQTPDETLRRVENGKMLGDCEDWSKFIQQILERWGKTSIAAELPGHCTCLWIDRTEDGRYHCHDIGTLGYTYNGCHFGIAGSGIEIGVTYSSGIEDVRRGFETMEEAVDSVLGKFRKHPLMQEGMKDWSIRNGVTEIKHMERNGNQVKTLISRTSLKDYVNVPPKEVPLPPSE